MINVMVACAFHFSGVPFASVELAVAGSTPADSAMVEHYGARSTVSVAPQPPDEGDWIHVILDADRPGNELIMHVNAGEGATRQGRLVNPAMPIAREMTGECQVAPQP
jgi:hypothetical protein